MISEQEQMQYEMGFRDGYQQALKEMNAVEIEPVRHGHWEFIGGYGYQYRCSRCVNCVERKTKYCPNCGARMDEVSE